MAEQLKVPLLPWQRLVADVATEQVDARPAFRDVAISVPRQSGKTTLLLVVIVWRMLTLPDSRLLFGAQTRLAARQRLLDEWWPQLRRAGLGSLFTPVRAMGSEQLRCVNGSLLNVLSTDAAAGHGQTADLVILDECWAFGPQVEQAVRPTMLTRPGAQIWMASTAGDGRSLWWRVKTDILRDAVAEGVADGTAYFEWSAPVGANLSDPLTWPGFHPACGFTVDADTLTSDARGMAPAEALRAYGNRWEDLLSGGWSVIPEDVWNDAREWNPGDER